MSIVLKLCLRTGLSRDRRWSCARRWAPRSTRGSSFAPCGSLPLCACPRARTSRSCPPASDHAASRALPPALGSASAALTTALLASAGSSPEVAAAATSLHITSWEGFANLLLPRQNNPTHYWDHLCSIPSFRPQRALLCFGTSTEVTMIWGTSFARETWVFWSE